MRRHTAVPTRKTVVMYVTAKDQDTFLLPVYEGEHEIASRNHHLGNIEIGSSGLCKEVDEKEQEGVEYGPRLGAKCNEEVNRRRVKVELHNEILTVTLGCKNVQGFMGPVMGRLWNWREIEEIATEAIEAREEDIKALVEGITAVNGVEVELEVSKDPCRWGYQFFAWC